MAEPTTKIYRVVIDSSKAVEGSATATRALQNLERQAGSMDSTLARMESAISSIGGAVKAHLALAIMEAGARLVELTKKAFEAAAGLDELAEQVGLSSRQLQGLQFAAVQSGVKLEQLDTGVAKFSKKIGDAATGQKEMIESLDRLGVKILDAGGKLRPTADLMQETAKKIGEIDDPAKKAAAAVEFFGKSGQRMLTMLDTMSKGLFEASDAAEKFGAMISDRTSKKLDEIADAMARAALKTRAFLAEGLVAVLDWLERNHFILSLQVVWETLKKLNEFGQSDSLARWFRDVVGAGQGVGGAIATALSGLPDLFTQVFTNAINNAIGIVEAGVNKITAALGGIVADNPTLARTFGVAGIGPISMGRIPGGNADPYGAYVAGIGNAYTREKAAFLAPFQQEDLRAADRRRAEAELLAANSPVGRSSAPSVGTSNPAARGAGEDVRKRLDKLDIGTARDLQAARDYANASEESTRAVAELEIHTKALKAVQDAYGDSAKTSTEAIKKKTAAVEADMRATEALNKLKDFNVATNALKDQNALLEAENRLIGATTEERARELAIIKATQEFEGKGLSELNAQQRLGLQNRIEQLTVGEKLKAQGEELKQSAERFATPFKNAFQTIQQAGADAWEAILKGGKFTFETVTDIARVSIRRVAAELINLVTIRPLIGFGAQALGSLGILSPSTVQSMGFGSTILGGAAAGAASGVAAGAVSGSASGGSSLLGGLGTGFGFGSLFSGGSTGGGWFGSIGNWLNSPIGSAGYISGMGPAGQGLQGLGGAGPGMFGNLTPLGAIGGLASMGFGIYNLATAKTPMGALGGGLGLVGGGLGLAAGAGLIGSAFGPVGMGLGLLGGLLGLFGGSAEPPIPPQPALDLSIGSFVPNGVRGFTASGYGMNGGGSLGTQAGTLGTTVSRLFRSADVSPIAGATYGGRIWSGVDHVLNGRTWADRPYTQTALLTPGGDQEFVTYNDGSRGLQAAADLLIAAVFKANVLRGGVGGASEALKAGVRAYDPVTAKDTQTVIALAGAYDKLGKVTGTAKEALDKISASFDDLADFADRAGLSMKPINDEIEKQSKRWAQDFIDNMLDPLALQLRALADEKDSALASAQYIRDHVAGVYVDMDKTVAYFTDKEAALRDQFYGGAVESLQQAINALSLGPLSNASPTTQFAALKSGYDTTLAQARAGDADAISRLAGAGNDYATSSQQMFASSPQYEALRQQILADLREVQASIQGGGTGGQGAPLAENSAATKAVLQQAVAQQAMIDELARQNAVLMAKLGQTNDLLQRLATNVK